MEEWDGRERRKGRSPEELHEYLRQLQLRWERKQAEKEESKHSEVCDDAHLPRQR
jgi:hypothetical protein